MDLNVEATKTCRLNLYPSTVSVSRRFPHSVDNFCMHLLILKESFWNSNFRTNRTISVRVGPSYWIIRKASGRDGCTKFRIFLILIKVPSLSSVNERIFSRLRRAKIFLHYIREYRSDNFYLSGKHL